MCVMPIQGLMGITRANCFIFLVFLLGISMVSSSEDDNLSLEVVVDGLLNPVTGEVDQNVAEISLMHCQDFILLKDFISDLDISFLEETTGSTNGITTKKKAFTKENVEKLINLLHPQLKQTLQDCTQKKISLLYVPKEERGMDSWYNKYLELLFSWPISPRRNLGSQAPASAPASTPVFAPNFAPSSESPSLGPAPSPRRQRARPSPQPDASPRHPFFPSPEVDKTSQSPSPGEDSFKNSNSSSGVEANGGNNHRKTIIIAVVVTTVVTSVVAAFFCLCCTRKRSWVRLNDDRPLLSLSMSDYSMGSSPPFGGPVKADKPGNQIISSYSNLGKKSSFGGNLNPGGDERPSIEAVTGDTKTSSPWFGVSSNTTSQIMPPLKPPPSRMGSTLPEKSPLAAPTGRVEPLSPEPPTFLKPPPSKATPRTPPPPKPAPFPPPPSPLGQPPPPPPGPRPPPPPGPRPPPPPMAPGSGHPRPPPPAPLGPKAPRPPVGPKISSSEGDGSVEVDAPKTKLKPFFWDKVLANPDHSMVWDQIKSGSFQFNEEMIESLFGYASADKKKNEQEKEASSHDPSPHFIQILDPKKAQNLSILLRALNVTTEEVRDALLEGNELPAEFLQTLLKMAPTKDEESKLRQFDGELSQLGPAERFLKALVGIPFAFKRMEALLFMCTLPEEVAVTKESLETLEVACKELRNSRLFLKLLEAVLKTGNRMNDGTFRGGAQAFKLDTLLKLSDVKGTDGKTTLLHFVVQEIIRSEGIRAAREKNGLSSMKTEDQMAKESSDDTEENYRSLGLEKVSGLSIELKNVKKAANVDGDGLTGTVAKLGHALLKTKDFLNSDMKKSGERSGFHETLRSFVHNAEVDIMWLREEEKRIMAMVKSTGDYFHGKAGKDEGLLLFVIVRDFLVMLDKACRDVRNAPRKPARPQPKEASASSSSSDNHHRSASVDPRQRLFPAIAERRMDHSSSDSDND